MERQWVVWFLLRLQALTNFSIAKHTDSLQIISSYHTAFSFTTLFYLHPIVLISHVLASHMLIFPILRPQMLKLIVLISPVLVVLLTPLFLDSHPLHLLNASL